MQFNAEFVAAGGSEMYPGEEDNSSSRLSEMRESFYSFLNNFCVDGIYIYRSTPLIPLDV